ncbi:MAG TPA: alpha-L-arabinofuranosidase C-terminal domain-containing protein, partial [Tepidisphaeraceae bacterium]|nr:alpha-L-arabinofuranosidase C-terminal domain-containing protein [Tepidisphaeraceae bacterium]
DYARLFEQVRQTRQSKKQFYLSFDEWNVWYRQRGGDGGWKEAPHLLEEVYNLEDALVCAQYLNSFIRRADIVKVACLAQIVNVIAPILTRRDGLLVQSIYHPIELMSQNARGVSLQTKVDSPTYKAGERGDVPAIDLTATYNPESCEASFFIVNRNPQADANVTLRFADRQAFRIITAEGIGGQDPKIANSWESPNAVKRFAVDAKIVDGDVQVPVKSPGFVAVRVATTAR